MRSAKCGRNSVVECQLPKLNVASSNLVARSLPKVLPRTKDRFVRGKSTIC